LRITHDIDLCYVACERIDGFWKLKSWDIAAGALIVSEGGRHADKFSDARFGTTEL
jgi:fructose-1,6-bisphosphatase/inositol monophosphatase family enzyme